MVIVDLATNYALLLWHMLWPITFGLALSSLVRSYVPKETIVSKLGHNRLKSAGLAIALGMASSVCNYATIGVGHTLRKKGASWSNSLAFMITSTDVGIAMMVTVYGFLGILFLEIMVLTSLSFIIAAYFLAMVLHMPAPEATAENAQEMKNSASAWRRACIFFHDDLSMTRKDILVGLLIASSVSVLMPSSWWELLFWNTQEHGFLAWLWNAIVGVIIAVITFGCSIGNVSLAAVMWWNGVSPGGVMGFLLSGLVTFPMLRMSYKYYGLAVTIKQTTVLVLGVVLSCLLMDGILDNASVYLVRSHIIATMSSMTGIITTSVLDLVLGGLGCLMYWQGKTGAAMSM